MAEKIYNFSAGPAVLPTPVLEKARDEMFSFDGCGMGLMELSHRSKQFEPVLAAAESGIRELLGVPDNYRILFLQGGATLQFSMVPINFMAGGSADYVITGAWGKKALKEAKRCGSPNVIYTSAEGGFKSVPDAEELKLSPEAAYVHYTSNETIEGVEFKYEIDTGDRAPVVCDASSNILSKPLDVGKYGLIYAGAQKNIGPSGVTLVIISDDLLARVPENQHSMLDYRLLAENDSMLNTPNTWGIYIISLVCEWLRGHGGLTGMQKLNEEKAAILYNAIDSSDGYYTGHADRNCRSLMNVTFRLPSEDLEKQFTAEATALGLDGLKGHRSVGGIRASIYNAFPRDGVTALVDFMQDFAQRNG